MLGLQVQEELAKKAVQAMSERKLFSGGAVPNDTPRDLAIQTIQSLEPVKKKEIPKMNIPNPQTLVWAIDPIQQYLNALKMQKLPIFAEAMNRNMTGLFYNFLDYKVEKKENIGLEVKGATRSGKSTGAISVGKYVSMRTGVIFTPKHVCPNEQYYIDLVKVAIDNQFIVVDEQLETHVGSGSFREMQYTEDLNNIIAKRCIHIAWLHPPEFVGRGGQYGLETAGRNFEYKLTKFLLYDMSSKTFGMSAVPLGFVIIPKYNDQAFSDEYEGKKDEHIQDLRDENIGMRQQRRLDEGFAIAKNPLFQKMKNTQQKIELCQHLFPMRTIQETMELVQIANMNLKLGIRQEDFDMAKKEVERDLSAIKDSRAEPRVSELEPNDEVEEDVPEEE